MTHMTTTVLYSYSTGLWAGYLIRMANGYYIMGVKIRLGYEGSFLELIYQPSMV